CGARPPITPQGRHRLQASFRQAFTCAFWRLGFRQSGFRRITRISRRAAPDTWARPLVSWHAIFPCILSDSGKPSDPEISPLISPRCAGDTTVRLMAHAGCKTVGSAYVGSNPTPATQKPRSEPVMPYGVTGFSVQNERLRKPSAVSRGLCVGQIGASPGL